MAISTEISKTSCVPIGIILGGERQREKNDNTMNHIRFGEIFRCHCPIYKAMKHFV